MSVSYSILTFLYIKIHFVILFVAEADFDQRNRKRRSMKIQEDGYHFEAIEDEVRSDELQNGDEEIIGIVELEGIPEFRDFQWNFNGMERNEPEDFPEPFGKITI